MIWSPSGHMRWSRRTTVSPEPITGDTSATTEQQQFQGIAPPVNAAARDDSRRGQAAGDRPMTDVELNDLFDEILDPQIFPTDVIDFFDGAEGIPEFEELDGL